MWLSDEKRGGTDGSFCGDGYVISGFRDKNFHGWGRGGKGDGICLGKGEAQGRALGEGDEAVRPSGRSGHPV